MRKLRDYTRSDIIALVHVGTALHDAFRRGERPGSPSQLAAWVRQIEQLLLDALEASDAIRIDEGMFVLRELRTDGVATQADLVQSLGRILSVLFQLVANYSFEPTAVDQATFGRFLRAARFESQGLGVGAWIHLDAVRSRAKIDATESDRCLARFLDEGLGQISTIEKLKIDEKAVDFAIGELDHHSQPAAANRTSRASWEKYLKDPANDTIGQGYSGVVCKNLKTAFDALGYRRPWGQPYEFDEELEQVVCEFQRAKGHQNRDGRVGPGTRMLLVDALLAKGFEWSRMQSVFEYDVALSFASEDRVHAEALAMCLRGRGVKVFYDDYERAELWGKDLYVHLHGIYSQRARYCVMFVSAHYAAKVWTTHERKAAQERALHEANHEYILPIRLDDTSVPGLASTIAYINIDMGIDRICELLVTKIRG